MKNIKVTPADATQKEVIIEFISALGRFIDSGADTLAPETRKQLDAAFSAGHASFRFAIDFSVYGVTCLVYTHTPEGISSEPLFGFTLNQQTGSIVVKGPWVN